jgi:hypothetical protein
MAFFLTQLLLRSPCFYFLCLPDSRENEKSFHFFELILRPTTDSSQEGEEGPKGKRVFEVLLFVNRRQISTQLSYICNND